MVQQLRAELFASPDFMTMMYHVQKCAQGSSHPKLDMTVRLLEEHFEKHGETSRVMVFTTYRSAVSELLRWFEKSEVVRAKDFIGQSSGKGEEEKGMPQKEQRAVVKKFRSGEFNVLVRAPLQCASSPRHAPFRPCARPRARPCDANPSLARCRPRALPPSRDTTLARCR